MASEGGLCLGVERIQTLGSHGKVVGIKAVARVVVIVVTEGQIGEGPFQMILAVIARRRVEVAKVLIVEVTRVSGLWAEIVHGV